MASPSGRRGPDSLSASRAIIYSITRSTGPARAIRGTDVTEFRPGSRGSLRLDAGRPDYLAPLLSVVCEELAEVRRRTSQ
jgi:hypothetical protein